jgi:hypothetical protein
MGREVRRVPLDFDHPLNEIWPGFLTPDTLHEDKCGVCDGSGSSGYARWMQARWYGHISFDPAETGSTPFTPETPAVRAFAERNVNRDPGFYRSYLGAEGEQAIVREAQRLCAHFNGSWSHHLAQTDVDALVEDGRLHDFTHTWVQGDGWQPKDPAPVVTAEQVNTWSISGGFGHDSINAWVVIRAACERDGQPYECGDCGGHGSRERYEGQRAEAEAWEPTGPPIGEGWQLWETVSEGSPISPVFASADDLATWMSDPARGDHWVPPEAARKFIEEGWAPSLIATPETGVVSGVEYIGWRDGAES